jgi:hypothetical protein
MEKLAYKKIDIDIDFCKNMSVVCGVWCFSSSLAACREMPKNLPQKNNKFRTQ